MVIDSSSSISSSGWDLIRQFASNLAARLDGGISWVIPSSLLIGHVVCFWKTQAVFRWDADFFFLFFHADDQMQEILKKKT